MSELGQAQPSHVPGSPGGQWYIPAIGRIKSLISVLLVALFARLNGCTKVSIAHVHNRMNKSIEVVIYWFEDRLTTDNLQVPSHAVGKEAVWAISPEEFTVVVSANGEYVRSTTFNESELPADAQGKGDFRIIVEESRTHLESASFWESSGVELLIFGPCCVICVVILGFLIRYEERKRKGPIIITRKNVS